MKKLKKYFPRIVLLDTLIYTFVVVMSAIILSFFKLMFREWVYIVSAILIIVGLIVGIIQLFLKIKRKSIKISLIIVFIILLLLSSPIICFVSALSYMPEYIVEKDGEKYVAYVKSFLKTYVYYYDYKNPIVVGNKKRIEEFYGKSTFEPNNNYENNIKRTIYYDKNGNIISTYERIANINDFYNHSITNKYQDLRILPENYSKEQAQKDNCFIIGAMVHNDNLYSEFMDKYNKKENAFIRVVQSTVEGDIFIIDVLYEAKNNKIHLVKDNTRDKFSAQEDRTIKYKIYEKTRVWNYANSQYWVAYNGELPDGTYAEYSIDSDELFIIATIN